MGGTVRVRSVVWFATGWIVSLVATVIVVQAWRVDAAPGDDDATLVPITPCRLVDTRKPGDDPLGPDEVRSFDAHGTNGPIAGSQCTIPAEAVGLSMNVTALDATAWTYWTIWPDGEPQPEASSLNPVPRQPPTPNAVTTPISTSGRFDVYNYAGTVDMLIDVNGYYTDTSLVELAGRLAAVEAAQAAGIDPAVLARITANETDIATNAADIAALDDREPFAVTAHDLVAGVGTTAEAVVSVSLTAPAAGQVTVNSTTRAAEGTQGDEVFCSIVRAGTPAALDYDYLQNWESGGTNDGGYGQLGATRVFDVAEGENAAFDLVCEHLGASASTAVDYSVLTAVFTPAP